MVVVGEDEDGRAGLTRTSKLRSLSASSDYTSVIPNHETFYFVLWCLHDLEVSTVSLRGRIDRQIPWNLVGSG